MAETPPALLAQRLLACAALACLTLAALLCLPIVELRRSGIIAEPLAALMILLAALIGTVQLTRARQIPSEASRAARLPQVFLVPALTLPAAALAWLYRPAISAPDCPPQTGFLLGGCAITLAFLLLIAERALAQTPCRTLPEAPNLRALAVVATGVAFLAGVLEILANLGVPELAGRLGDAVAFVAAAIALELAIRAALRVFLPPPAPEAANAATYSLIARVLTAGAGAKNGISAPLRQHFGIDFSRSWALAYLRSAALPMAAFLGLVAWGLTGVTLVPIDGRAIYERFGAPVAVLHSGLHTGLPWPLGTTRPLEFGAVHEISLEPRAAGATTPPRAEDPSPIYADRLWETPHPGEITLVIASNVNNRQSFQSVSADLHVLYRAGLTDANARQAAYATADPEALVRALAGRIAAQYFAARTLDGVLGANREAMAETLRARLQSALDKHATGLEAVGIIIEAIHPPAGAADAYHNVRAAEIAARTSVAVEHGAAATIAAQSRQYAYSMTSGAHAAAAEDVAHARTNFVRFNADREAAHAGGQSFLLERYFTALGNALARAPKTIIDHRLNWPEAPVLDLRPYSAAAGTGAGKEE